MKIWLIAALATILAPISALAQSPEPVKVGLIVPLSGPWARQGEVMRGGAELAIADINKAGGVKALGGRPLELMVFDAGDSVERAKNAAQRMVANNPDLVASVGAFLSSFTLAVTEVTERANLPVLTLSYSDLITGRGYHSVFQTSATGDELARQSLPVLMKMAEKASGKRPERVGLVMDNTAASVSFVEPMKAGQLEELGLDLVVDETFTPPLSNATPLIQTVRSQRPDLLFLFPTVISDAKLLLQKLTEFGLGQGRLPTVSNGAAMVDPDLLKTMPPQLLEGVMSIMANWSARGQEDLIERYRRATGEPWLTQNALCTYGHVWIIKEALEKVGRAEREAVGTALHEIDLTDGPAKLFPGGRIRFDEAGRRQGAGIYVVQWQKGRSVTVYPPEAAMADPVWPSR